jgi:hypothetical protein
MMVQFQAVTAEGWFTGWSYRKSHVINSASGAGTNYQVKIIAHYSNFAAWTTKQPLPLALSDAPGAVYNGKLYVFGGYGTSPTDYRGEVYEYDPSINSWTQKADMPTARWGVAAVTYNSKIYVFGGRISGNIGTRKVERFDPVANSWATLNDMPAQLAGGIGDGIMAVTVSSKIYLFYDYYTYEYNPETGEYVQKTNGPVRTSWACCAHVNVDGEDRIYLIGGLNIANGKAMNVNYYYRPTNNDWSSAQASAPEALWGILRDNPVINNKIYYGFGLTGSAFRKTIYAYDPESNVWSSKLSDAAYERDGLACGVINNKIYAVGGRNSIGSPAGLNFNEEFDPYGENIDNGENVFLNEKCRSDFGDVRFTRSDGATLLDYWMEEKVDGGYAIFWVEVADNLSTNPATIYVYYGKSDASTTSNGANTFVDFDDFEDGSITGWTAGSSIGNWEESSGLLKRVGTTAEDGIFRNSLQPTNLAVETEMRINSNYWAGIIYRSNEQKIWGQSSSVDEFYFELCNELDADILWRIDNGADTKIDSLTRSDYTTFSKFSIRAYGTSHKVYKDGMEILSATDSNYQVSGYAGFAARVSSNFEAKYFASRKYVDPEPGHGSWGSEEISNYVMINQAFVSDERADVGSVQLVGFHAKWSINGSDVVEGNVYVNGTSYVTNSTGWINFSVESSIARKDKWVVTGVNCNGVTTYSQTVQSPSIIWNRIKITDGGVSKGLLMLGEKAIVWFKAIYEYDGDTFDGADGVLYLNGFPMSWSTTNNRWEYDYTATTVGAKVFTISGVFDSLYNLKIINDAIGAQTLDVWSTPFSVISNSTVSELVFNSTSKILSFTVSGDSGTTGYTNVTITKTLIEDISQLQVYFDGKPINSTIIATDYYWQMHFTYNHSTHKVAIILGAQHTESLIKIPFEIVVASIGMVTMMLAAILFAIKKRRPYRAFSPDNDLPTRKIND